MRTAVLLPNPAASGFTGANFREVKAALRRTFDVHAQWANGPAEIEQLAREAAQGGAEIAVAMGGDGAVHHVANGLVGSRTALGIIPAGTTNVMAKILGIPPTGPEAAGAIGQYAPTTHTLAHVTATTSHGADSRYAVFALGMGFDAEVAERAERQPYSKVSLGALHYARTAFSQILSDYRQRTPNLTAEANGRSIEAVSVMVQVHDRYTYFGRIPMFLTKSSPVGLTAVAISELTPLKALDIARRAITNRTLVDAPGCTVMHDVHKLVVTADPPAHHHADGEPLGTATRLEITPAANAIWILAPS